MSKAVNPLGLATIPSISSEGLVPVGRRSSLANYLSDLWERRHFIVAESRAKMSSSTRRNLLGYAWLFINPLFSVMTFWFIFGFVLGTQKNVENFIGYLVIGVFFFQYTNRSVNDGTGAIRQGAAMIRGFQFPRASLPISAVVRNFLDFIPSVIVMIVILAVVPPVEHITWRVILVLPVIALQTLFNVGLACFLARLGHAIPDISNLISIVSRFWLYGSGVFFVIDKMLAEHPTILSIMHANPMYAYLNLTRNSLLYGIDSPPWVWISATAWAFGALMVGFLYFWRGEETYGRQK